jgi:protein involved in polysaccharide export with SLBB domain
MKKLLLLSSIFLTFVVSAQIDIDKSKINPAYLNFLPSNANPADLRPSDIPSEQVLKQMGLSASEIDEAMNYKFSRGQYTKGASDTIDTHSALSKFYTSFGDTLVTDTTTYPRARIYGQDIFRNNRLSFYQKALDAKAPENYKVGSGDEISISVWGYSEFSETLLVDDRGYITPSSYGRIYVKGLTFEKMRSLLKSRFSSFLDMQNSEIDVTLAYSRVITVNIVGEVYQPGSYSIPAINTAFNALIAAKGPNQLGTVRNIYLKRDGEIVDSLDVYQFLFNPTRSQDIYMQDGDYLFIPPAQHIVEVSGAVNRPYTYEAKSGESVVEIIKYAGGFTTNAFTDIITLKRIDYNSIRVNDVHKDHANSTTVQNGDEVIVNTISNKLSNLVSVKGSIGVEGDYEFIKGESLLSLLNRAKCIDEKTFLDKVYIIRLNEDRTKTHIAVNLNAIINDEKHEDNILMKEYDIVRVLSVNDFDDEFFISVFGAVRGPGEFEFGVGMNLQDLLLQSGGLTQQAEGSKIEVSRIMDYDISSNKLKPRRAVVKNIKIGEDLILSSEAQEFMLQPFDQVFVRVNPDYEEPVNIVLMGEVKYPGTYSLLSKDEKISSVIKRAGGLTSYAFLDGVKMFRKFEVKHINNNELNIPDILLDSILTDAELSSIYNKELLDRERLKAKYFSYDSLVYNVVYFDLEKAISKSRSKHNLVLLAGDSVIIPKILDVVKVTGDLHNINGSSISAPFFGKRADYYVRNFAGGYSKDNKKSSTIVVHANGVTKKSLNLGLFTISPKVKPGTTIKVISEHKIKLKKKEDIDYNKHIESVITKITAVMSLWLLIDRVNNSF